MKRRTTNHDRARRLLEAELDSIIQRLGAEGDVPRAPHASGDFFDVAQGVELQELARLNASRLTERARRLRVALTRLSDGAYGVCAECGGEISSKRLLAIPDVTTCVGCQERLEGASGIPRRQVAASASAPH